MKKILLLCLSVINLLAFQLPSFSEVTENIDISGTVANIADSGKEVFGMDGESSTINVDSQCTKLFESYDLNMEGLLSTAALYGASNSNKIIGFFNQNKKNNISKSDVKNLANNVSKNYLWVPLQVEKLFGEKIYENRVKFGDVILPNTKNYKYKKLYKKIDIFKKKYYSYLKENNLSYPYDIKIYILSTKKKAESLPYGYIFISEDYMKSDKYETILAHELSHISKRHPTKEIQYRIVSSYDSVTQILDTIKGLQKDNIEEKFALAYLTPEIIQKTFEFYSQEQEIEADSCGLKTVNSFIPKRKNSHVKNFIYNINHSGEFKKEKGELKAHPEKELRIKNIKEIAKTI